MSKKRFIDTSFWSDVWVVDGLSPEERYFFLYLITNDKTSIAGVYELSLKTMAFETDFDREKILRMFTKMASKVAYKNGWVVLRNAIKNQNYKNEKIRRGIELVLEACPAECLEFIHMPKDFDVNLPKKEPQQGLFDRSSMSHDESSHSDADSDTDSKSDSEAVPADRPEPKNRLSKSQKRSYAKAVEMDRNLQEKELKSMGRKPTGNGKTMPEIVRETLRKKHGLNV